MDTGAFNGEDADIQFVVQGSGFTYSGSFPNIELTGGTIESFSLQTEAGVELASFAGFSIDAVTFTAALDAYTAGGPSNPDPSALDAIFKALQYDTVGGAGNDLIEGGDLADILAGGLRTDVLIGGAGRTASMVVVGVLIARRTPPRLWD